MDLSDSQARRIFHRIKRWEKTPRKPRECPKELRDRQSRKIFHKTKRWNQTQSRPGANFINQSTEVKHRRPREYIMELSDSIQTYIRK